MSIHPRSELSGKVALITGANTGIGAVTALELARAGAHVIAACRSASKTEPVLAEIRAQTNNPKVEFLELDLGDFASVRACAAAFLARDLPLHLLINNAGLAGSRGITKSGFELAFGVNHMGHFLLTQLLLERIRKSAPARIVTVASRAHYRCKGIDFAAQRERTRTRTALVEYGVSKLANVLFSAELARRLQGSGVTTYSLHPGVVASDIWRSIPQPFRFFAKLGMITPEEGAKTTLHCATSATCAGETGLYYDKQTARAASKLGNDPELARTLWAQSEAWLA
jgi:NAD(P)-dependent dehydrogenase (short-subunit alcohol dehydrogenase family)